MKVIRTLSNKSSIVSVPMARMSSVPYELDNKVSGDRANWFSTSKDGSGNIWACHCEVFSWDLYYVFEDERGAVHSQAEAKDSRNWKLKALYISEGARHFTISLNEPDAYRWCKLVNRLPTPCSIEQAAGILGLHETSITNALQAIDT